MGKRVVIPRVRGSRLVLSELRDLQQDLRPGAFGVWEPSPRTTRPVDPERLDLVLVPGLAFDRQGHRLGRGRGYFDRLLAAVPRNIPRVGLCFDFQLFDHLPLRPHDQPVSAVLAA